MLRSIARPRRNYSVTRNVWNFLSGKNDNSLELANTDPKIFDSPFKVNYLSPIERKRELSVLPNGVRVFSETPALPGPVTVSLMFEVGSANETAETSGALLSIKSTYYKTHLKTNETINYAMVEMSGGKYDMDYNRESSIFKASCLSHDVSDIVSMMADCAMEPRSSVSANVAIAQMEHQRKVFHAKNPGLKDTDLILSQIYGASGLGMPLYGNPDNTVYLNAQTLQTFQIANNSPKKLIIGGLGVENHNEFVCMVGSIFDSIAQTEAYEPPKPKFTEIDIKNVDATAHKNEIYLLFESASSKHPDFIRAHLAKELFGSADVTNPLCQIKNNGLIVRDLYSKDKSIYAAETFYLHFKETGIFGFRLSSSVDHTNQNIDSVVKLIKSIDSLSEEALATAKKRLVRKIIESVEDDYSRITEMSNHYSNFGDFKLDAMIHEIKAVNLKDLAAFVKKTVKGKSGVYVRGPAPNQVYNIHKLKELLK